MTGRSPVCYDAHVVASIPPIQHPALTPAERLVVLCSAYDRCAEPLLREHLAPLSPSDWPQVLRMADQHQLSSYLWYQLERVAAALPRSASAQCQQRYYTGFKTDLYQATVLEALARAFHHTGAPVAMVKGPVLHHWLYADRPLPRGASDLDVLVCGGPADLAAAVEAVTICGFTLTGPQGSSCPDRVWRQAWSINSELTVHQRRSDGQSLKLELHRAPSFLHAWGLRHRQVMAWFQQQRAPISWKGMSHSNVTMMPGLSTTGTFVYLAINLLKDGTPTIRAINDVALLIDREGHDIDLEALAAASTLLGLSRVVASALAVARQWRGVSLPEPWPADGHVPKFLQVPEIVRHPPVVETGAWMGSLGRIRGIGSSFGWNTVGRAWLGYERARAGVQPPGTRGRLRYLAMRPLVLATRLRS